MHSSDILRDKKILLFAPQGKGIYGSAIYNELFRLGADVHIYNERISTSSLSKALYRLGKRFMRPWFKRYIKRIINETAGISFDHILIIRGEVFSPAEIGLLRKANPAAEIILYLWDSLQNNDKRNLFSHCDKIFSFDPEDCNLYNTLRFRPLFYLPDYSNLSGNKNYEIDLLFVGTIHTERFKLLKRIENEADKLGLNTYFYFYFPSRILFLFRKLKDKEFRRSKMKDFNYTMIPSVDVAALMSKSRASLDMQAPSQSGLTIRTLEVLGAKRKLITTNQTIKKYDFYNEKNIYIISNDSSSIPNKFINEPFQAIPSKIYDNYSLNSWIKEILF